MAFIVKLKSAHSEQELISTVSTKKQYYELDILKPDLSLVQ